GLGGAVLDCWENEPAIDPELAYRVAIATPHIAGHSLDAKAEATRMLFDAARGFFKDDLPAVAPWVPAADKPPPPLPTLELSTTGRSDEALLHQAVSAVYNIEGDDLQLRSTLSLDAATRSRVFDALRENYRPRREFPFTAVRLIPPRPSAQALLVAVG